MRTPLYGLVVCGGRSSRMGTDKSMLNYHGQPQRYYLYDMLRPLCEKVFISCNKEQAGMIPDEYERITDAPEYPDMGPMTAVLSAHQAHPDAAFLVVGCDYPLLAASDLSYLLAEALRSGKSVAFRNPERGITEPLISVFQLVSLQELKKDFSKFNCSLRQFLEQTDAHIPGHPQPERLASADTKEDYLRIQHIIRKDNQ